jgi:predicted RNA-binding Zn-ribbon protein involved in translation (DUF1610 family)
MYDFYEYLGSGIIAARTGRPAEAFKYLSTAAKIKPNNPRVNLWLASVAETFEQQKKFLEKALKLAPNLFVAQALLEQLYQQQTIIDQHATDFIAFTCQYCGGKQHFDPDLSGLVCLYCKRVEPLTLKTASEAETDLEMTPQDGSGNWSVQVGQVNCGACGARMSILPEQGTHTCPFCGSEQITIQSAMPNLVAPTAIAPFQYNIDDVLKTLGEHWNISPSKLIRLIQNKTITLSPIYLPFWTFDGRVQIYCALGYRVSSRELSNSERVIVKGEWPTEKSWFECDVDDLSVYAGRSISNQSIMQITPFDLKSLFEYKSEILAGWQAELYNIALADAAVEAHKRMRDDAFRRAARHLLFMDPAQMLEDDVLILDRTYKLILLPVWIVRHADLGKTSLTLINGQTGKIVQKGISDWRKWLKRYLL